VVQALITINGVPGSNSDLPINTLVQLNNQNNGGETTFHWSILYQPPGPADTLSSTVIQNPTFTPKKEGTYLIRLIVNQGQASEQRNQVIVGIRQLKTLQRVPATGETTEDTNWSEPAVNEQLRLLSDIAADPGLRVVELGYNAAVGDVVKFDNLTTIKAGLPGSEQLLVANLASAASAADVSEALAVVVKPVRATDGLAVKTLAWVRTYGLFVNVANVGVAGQPAYLSDTGQIDTVPGTNMRRIGTYVGPKEIVFYSEAFTDKSPPGSLYHLVAPTALTVLTNYQYLVHGALIIDPGASMTLDSGAQLVII